MMEKWRVNCEDIRDTSKMLGYELNPGNVITILEVDYKGNYVEEDRSAYTTPRCISQLIRNQTLRKKKGRVLERTIRHP